MLKAYNQIYLLIWQKRSKQYVIALSDNDNGLYK